MTTGPRNEGGMALIEALIASAILGIGLVGAMQLSLKTLYISNESRQHTVAQQLAHEGMDCLISRLGPCLGEDLITVQGVSYTRQARSTPRGASQISDLQVSVEWTAMVKRLADATGTAEVRRIEWHSSDAALPGWVGATSP